MRKKVRWSKRDLDRIRKWYPDKPTKWIAQRVGRSLESTYRAAYMLGLRKSEAYMRGEMVRQGEKLKVVGIKGRFIKGQPPKNKGKKVPPHVLEAMRPTMFKKGQKAINEKWDGHERVNVDGYLEVRVAKNKYVHKHRLVWQQAGKAVPKGYVVTFKDGNKLNCELDNLTLITRREIMERNTIHRLPPELKETIRTLTNLKKRIDAKEQNQRPA